MPRDDMNVGVTRLLPVPLLLGPVLLVAGCSSWSAERTSDLLAERPALVIGHGQDVFESFPSNQPLELEAGPQGGFHSWLQLRVYGLSAELLEVHYTHRWPARADTEVAVLLAAVGQPKVDEQGNAMEAVGPLFLQVEDPRCANDQGLEVDVTVSEVLQAEGLRATQLGESVQASVVVRLALDEQYRDLDCE